ncbi:uncharacterized protein METZ01_LOCUS147837 [marine metagenome]|uniref:Uncharacterized protein n=1 Tax=marine metagenome TaxID=408172 RepID=A0A382A211_9ZZZZ
METINAIIHRIYWSLDPTIGIPFPEIKSLAFGYELVQLIRWV